MSDRFSIYLLEKDVLEYHEYKKKFNHFDQLIHCSYENKQNHQKERDFWYKKYINKMRYLERNYRKTSIYTSYHAHLEGKKEKSKIVEAKEIKPIIVTNAIPVNIDVVESEELVLG